MSFRPFHQPPFPPPPPLSSIRRPGKTPPKYGARRFDMPIDLPWSSDVQSFCEKSPLRFGLHLEAWVVTKYQVDDDGRPGEFNAWSIIQHCHSLMAAIGQRTLDKSGLDKLREQAEKIVEKEIVHLKELAGRRTGEDKEETLKIVEHRSMILLLGHLVLVKERNCNGDYPVRKQGTLEEFGDEGLFVDGKLYYVKPKHLLNDDWRVTKVKAEEGEGDSEDSQTSMDSEPSQIGMDNEGFHTSGSQASQGRKQGEKKKGKKAGKKEGKIEQLSEEADFETIEMWVSRLTPEQSDLVTETLRNNRGKA